MHDRSNETYDQEAIAVKVLILGAAGMLGRTLVTEAKKRNFQTFDADQHNASLLFDITEDQAVKALIRQINPNILINTVAMVSHNTCENNPANAYLVNARPASIIAQLAKEQNFYNIHISTDHFYTNDKNKKHTESDDVCLVNEYARTKYAAECFALTYAQSLVVRTNIVGFRNEPERATFVEWVIQSLKTEAPITLFDDYYTSSIDVTTFSKILFDIIGAKKQYGLLNIACREATTKQKFIEQFAQKLDSPLINASTGSVHALPGLRAESSGLDVTKAERITNYKLPTLDQVLDKLANEYLETMP